MSQASSWAQCKWIGLVYDKVCSVAASGSTRVQTSVRLRKAESEMRAVG